MWAVKAPPAAASLLPDPRRQMKPFICILLPFVCNSASFPEEAPCCAATAAPGVAVGRCGPEEEPLSSTLKNLLAFPPYTHNLATDCCARLILVACFIARTPPSPRNRCSNFNFLEFVCKCQHLTAA